MLDLSLQPRLDPIPCECGALFRGQPWLSAWSLEESRPRTLEQDTAPSIMIYSERDDARTMLACGTARLNEPEGEHSRSFSGLDGDTQ
jgi:hypothetical protein